MTVNAIGPIFVMTLYCNDEIVIVRFFHVTVETSVILIVHAVFVWLHVTNISLSCTSFINLHFLFFLLCYM
jgi:hypothetical protein